MSQNPELRTYLGIIFTCTVVVAISIVKHGLYPNLGIALRHSLFACTSVMTTTGFGTEDFAHWTELAKAILLLLMRSEEHTSELQSLMRISYAVFCLKKK